MNRTPKEVAEQLVDGFKNMWNEHDHSTYCRGELNKFLKELLKDGVVCFRSRAQQGSWVVRLAVSGDIVFLSDMGEVHFLNLGLAIACKNLLDSDHQILLIIE